MLMFELPLKVCATGEVWPVADVAASFQEAVCDVLTAKAYLGDGKKVLVFAPDSAFGKSNVEAVTKVLGGAGAALGGRLGGDVRLHPAIHVLGDVGDANGLVAGG